MPQRNKSGAILFTLIGSLTLLLGVAACTWQELRPDTNSTRRLYVIGDFERLKSADVAQAAQRHLGAGFFEVEVQDIKDAVNALPWVASVSVHRRWPDSVVVRVSEHRPLAHWGESALVSENKKIFTPLSESIPPNLSWLAGPDDSVTLVLDELKKLQDVLVGSGYEIDALRLDTRGSWQAVLKDGLELRLGRAEPQQRLRGFVDQLTNHNASALKSRLEEAGYVDLRYTDGFAVGGAHAERVGQSDDGPNQGPNKAQGEQHDEKA